MIYALAIFAPLVGAGIAGLLGRVIGDRGAMTASVAGMVVGIGTVWIANWLIFTLFLSEIAKLIFQIIYYRRGTEG